MIFTIIVITLLILTNAVTLFLLIRAVRRMLEFDVLFQLMVDDLDTNIRYFAKLADTPMVSDTDEVQQAAKNMRIMGLRLNEFLIRSGEISNRRVELDPKKVDPKKRRPVVA
jgi:hypothetical protein